MAVNLGSAYGKVVLDATGVKKGTQEAASAFGSLEAKGVASMAALGLSVAGMGVLFKKTVVESVGLAKGFETSTARLELAAGSGAESFEVLHDAAIAVGDDTRLLGVSASGAAESMEGLYKSGLNSAVIFGDLNGYMAGTVELGGALRASVDLAAASELDMVQASDLAAVALSTFGAELETDAEKAEFINKALDNFVRAADASVAEVSDLAAGLANVGPDAARMGFSIQDVNNALALLSTRGIKGAEAGTALKSMMLNLNRQTGDVVETLQDLGITLYDSEGRMRSLPEIIGQLEDAFATLTDEQRDHAMQTLAGNYGLKAMSTLVAEGTDGWYKMADATAHATGIQEKAARMAQTLAGRQEALEGNIETLQIMIGEKLLPVALDWTNWLIEMVDTHGPALVEMFGKLAEGAQWLSDGLQGEGDAVQNTVVQLGGLAIAGLGAHAAYVKLAPVVKGIGPLLSEAATGMQLLAGGASTAEVTSLGFGAALGPIVAGLAAVATTLYAVNQAIELHKQIQEETAKVGDQWGEYLERQVEAQTGAIGVADAYVAKRQEIGQILDDQRGLAALATKFINRQEVATASTEALNAALLAGATSYDDYRTAVDRVNEANTVTVQGAEMVNGAWVQVTKTVQQDAIRAYDELTFRMLAAQGVEQEGLSILELRRRDTEITAETVAESASETAQIVEDANRREAEAYLASVAALQGAGVITRQEAESMRAVVVDEQGQIITSTEALGEAQRKLAEVAAEAWDAFAQEVYTGVQKALEAYREGNAELLAEQQTALGQMLLNQAEHMALSGQISESQLRDMRVGIHAQFGIAIDETQIGTDHILGLFSDFAAGGKTTIEEVIGAILNIGPETEAAAKETEAALAKADENWLTFKENVGVYTTDAGRAAYAMSLGITEDVGQLGGVFEAQLPGIMGVQRALLGLPTEHRFTLHLDTEGALPSLPSGPDANKPGSAVHFASGTQAAPGGWAWYGELGPELGYVPQGTQILTAQESLEMVQSATELAGMLAAGGLGGGAAVPYRGAPGGTSPAQGEPVVMHNYVRDELDIDILARRVAEYIRGRG